MNQPSQAPTRAELDARMEKLRQHPRYREAMGKEIRGRDVVSHRADGARNGFFLLVLALVGYLAYQKGWLAGPLERWGPGPLFALGAFSLFVISRGTRRRGHDMAGPGRSREVMVIHKRHAESPEGPGRPKGLDDRYYVTLMDPQGVQEEVSCKRRLYESLQVRDTGAAYLKGRTMLRFEKVDVDAGSPA